jgi:hypothetical protein
MNNNTIVHVNNASQTLAKLEVAKQTLAECRTLPDIVKIREQAIAAETYAKAAKLSAESVAFATEIKLLAERRAGEMLANLEKDNRGGDRRSPSRGGEGDSEYRQVVNQARISKDQSARWQKLAKLDDKEMEEKIATVKQASVNGKTKSAAAKTLDELVPRIKQNLAKLAAADIKAAVYHVFETSQKEMKKFKSRPEQQKFKTATLEFLKNKLIPSTPVPTKRQGKKSK